MTINSVVVDIRIGTPGRHSLSAKRIDFQNKVLNLIFPNKHINRIAHSHSFDYSYGKLDAETGHIQEILGEGCDLLQAQQAGPIKVLLIDFTESPYDLVRDPILLHLASQLEIIFKAKICTHAVLLLPFTRLPNVDSLLVSRLNNIKSEAPDSEVAIIVNDGSIKRLPDGSDGKVFGYSELLQAQQEDPLDLLKKKMVKRIGRFKNARHRDKTRIYSYLIDNCVQELISLIKIWWEDKKPICDAIIYDAVNIPSMPEAVQAFAEEKGIRCFNISSIKTEPTLLKDIKALVKKSPKKCLILLDVVETGQTFLQHVEWLKSNDCLTCNDVLAVINRGKGLIYHINGFTITSLLGVDHDPDDAIKMQDSLGLPYSSDSGEYNDKIRSFDMWFMAHEAGWEKEPEVPKYGSPYKIIPIFTQILEKYGDWIAYKMNIILKREVITQDIFIIHPDEPGANSVSDKLRNRMDPHLMIVRVPRSHIDDAKNDSAGWDKIINSIDKNEEWYARLRSLREANAIITDIFNASGSTFNSLHSLLSHFGISCVAYFPFVDRDGFNNEYDRDNFTNRIIEYKKYPIPRFCLYSWYGPRNKKEIGIN